MGTYVGDVAHQLDIGSYAPISSQLKNSVPRAENMLSNAPPLTGRTELQLEKSKNAVVGSELCRRY